MPDNHAAHIDGLQAQCMPFAKPQMACGLCACGPTLASRTHRTSVQPPLFYSSDVAQKCKNLEEFLSNLEAHGKAHQGELDGALATLRSASDALYTSASDLMCFLERAGLEPPPAVTAVMHKLAATARESGMASVHSPSGTPLARIAGAEDRVLDWLAATPSTHHASTGALRRS